MLLVATALDSAGGKVAHSCSLDWAVFFLLVYRSWFYLHACILQGCLFPRCYFSLS